MAKWGRHATRQSRALCSQLQRVYALYVQKEGSRGAAAHMSHVRCARTTRVCPVPFFVHPCVPMPMPAASATGAGRWPVAVGASIAPAFAASSPGFRSRPP